MKTFTDALLRPEQAEYLGRLEMERDPLLAEMERFATAHQHPISDPEVATFLWITAHARQPKTIVEVGTNIGYGAIVLARAAEGARVVTIERSSELVTVARAYVERAGLSARVEVREGTALEELEKIDAPQDFYYIDCLKQEYPEYLARIVPRLSARGVIVADNVLWRGWVARENVPEDERARVGALRAFNAAITSHPELRGMVLPFGDGVAFAVKR